MHPPHIWQTGTVSREQVGCVQHSVLFKPEGNYLTSSATWKRKADVIQICNSMTFFQPWLKI
jgi:hypothetical protein